MLSDKLDFEHYQHINKKKRGRKDSKTDASVEAYRDTNEQLQSMERLAITLQSLVRLNGRKDPYDIVLLDEVRLNAEHCVSTLMNTNGNSLMETVEVYEKIIHGAKIVIMMGADVDVPSTDVMVPSGYDLTDPKRATTIGKF
jgi:hypothetical protein